MVGVLTPSRSHALRHDCTSNRTVGIRRVTTEQNCLYDDKHNSVRWRSETGTAKIMMVKQLYNKFLSGFVTILHAFEYMNNHLSKFKLLPL